MMQVSFDNNQLKVVVGDQVTFYSFFDIKSYSSFITPTLRDRIVESYVFIKFISGIDTLKIQLSKVTNQPLWANNETGIDNAISDIKSWSDFVKENQPKETIIVNTIDTGAIESELEKTNESLQFVRNDLKVQSDILDSLEKIEEQLTDLNDS